MMRMAMRTLTGALTGAMTGALTMIWLGAGAPVLASDPNTGFDESVWESFEVPVPADWHEVTAETRMGGQHTEFVPPGDTADSYERKLFINRGFSMSSSAQGFIDLIVGQAEQYVCSSLRKFESEDDGFKAGHFRAAVQSMHCITKQASRRVNPRQRVHEIVVMLVVEGRGGALYSAQWASHTDEEQGIDAFIEREVAEGLALVRRIKLCNKRLDEPCLSAAERAGG